MISIDARLLTVLYLSTCSWGYFPKFFLIHIPSTTLVDVCNSLFWLSWENLNKSYGRCCVYIFLSLALTHSPCLREHIFLSIIMILALTESVQINTVFSSSITEQTVVLQFLFSNHLKQKNLTGHHYGSSVQGKGICFIANNYL